MIRSLARGLKKRYFDALQSLLNRLLYRVTIREYPQGKLYINGLVKGVENVEFEGNNAIGAFCEFRGNIRIGYATTLGVRNMIAGDVEIGRYCQFAPDVSINTYNHPQTHITTYINSRLLDGKMAKYKTSRKTVIGSDVWIGKNVVILDGVTIGNGAIVAAGSVVTKDIPDYYIAAGVPAKPMKKRFPDKIIEELQELRWWEKSEEEIKKIEDLFEKDLSEKESIYE